MMDHEPTKAHLPQVTEGRWEPMPEIDLRQLLQMTDDTGMFQHAVYATPDPNHGYCIDDNARALIATLMHGRLRDHDERVAPLNRYFGFLAYAFNDERKRFRNFMGYDRHWLEDVGSQDSQARTLWALGLTTVHAPTAITREHAQNLILKALPALEDLEFIRSWAFALIGLCFFLETPAEAEAANPANPANAANAANSHGEDNATTNADKNTAANDHQAAASAGAGAGARARAEAEAEPQLDPAPAASGKETVGAANERRQRQEERQRVVKLRDDFAQRLYEAWVNHASDDWPWWEDEVTYDNAKLSHALMLAGRQMHRPRMVEAGLKSLAWLCQVQSEIDDEGQAYLSIIGNEGWLVRGKERARFDQQPLEAYALVDACLLAARSVDDPDQRKGWEAAAWRCFEWFRGRNELGVSLYSPDTGGCQDGLRPEGVNKNQGAESVLAYLLSVLELHLYRAEHARPMQAALTEPRSVGLGVIGVSDFARFSLDSYASIDGLKPVAAWNRTPAKARALAEHRGLRAYDELWAFLADPAVELVHVASTPNMHADHALAALNAGKHVLSEKPIAIDLADAHEMQAAANQRDRVLAVNFVMRHGPLVEPIRTLIQSHALGAALRGMFTNRAGDAGLPPDHWFWNEAVSGGIFVEHGVHFFDLLSHWLGDGSLLSAHQLRRPRTELVDQVACELRYGPQTTVSFYHGFTQGSQTDSQDLRLIFERGQILVRGWVASELEIDAVLSNSQIEQVEAVLNQAGLDGQGPLQTRTLERFDAHQSTRRRHRIEPIDRHVRVRWSDPREKQSIYADAARRLMEDVLRTIHDRRHTPRVSADQGRAALKLALDARRLAQY